MSGPDKQPKALADLAQHIREAGVALAKAYEPIIKQSIEALKPLVELANSPQGQAMIAAHEARKAAGLCCGEPCHCLCGRNHPGRALCRGEAPPSDIQTVSFRTSTIGSVEVAMCPPCAEATLTRRAPAMT